VPAAPVALDDLVERSADRERVRAALERLEEAQPEVLPVVLGEARAAGALVAVLAASRSLGALLRSDAGALAVLTDLDRQPQWDEVSVEQLAAWSRRELLRVAARDLVGLDDLEATTTQLSRMAARVLHVAVSAACERERDVSLAVIGMGKLGADELNYASDVDVVFVGSGEPQALERAARTVLDVTGRCFRVDADLRPEGRDGPLVRSLESYRTYWARWADPWERQALLKAAPVAGDEDLGAAWAGAAAEVVWGRALDSEELRYLRSMKVRAEEEVARRGLAEREVKRGPGGIRDIEFSAQLLQLVHGALDGALRARGTIPALRALTAGGYVDAADAATLAGSYRFLRRVEHALQLEDQRQTHSLPEPGHDRRRLARVLGFSGSPAAGPTEAFDVELARRRREVRAVHERLWFRPLLDALSGAGTLDPEAAADRLEAFGFTDLERTRQAVTELTRGLTRSSRMMRSLLPLLLDWLSSSPDPDLGLLGLRRLATGGRRASELASAFRDSPEVARSLALLLGTSRVLGDVLVANPDLVERLSQPDRLLTRPRPDLVESASAAVTWRDDMSERQRGLRRWHQRHLVGVAARDIGGAATVEQVGADLSALAEAGLEVALQAVEPKVPFAVVGFGRLGGAELGYGSDLDIAFVHAGGSDTGEEADRVAAALLRFLGGATPAERIWDVDPGLRPEGRNGPLSRSLQSWRAYLSRWASTWERQAYLRARVVAGDAQLGRELEASISDAIWSRPLGDEQVREIRRMKVRVEQERVPADQDPEFHLKLGPGALADVEWTVQLLQLLTGTAGTSTLASLRSLVDAGHIESGDAAVLSESYRFCERVRNRSHLVVGSGDSLPSHPEQAVPLARSIGCSVSELREEYRRVTRRARRVVDRRFYGRE